MLQPLDDFLEFGYARLFLLYGGFRGFTVAFEVAQMILGSLIIVVQALYSLFGRLGFVEVLVYDCCLRFAESDEVDDV